MSKASANWAARTRSAFVALVSGLLLPAALLFGIVVAVVPVADVAGGNATFWGSVVTGSVLAATLVLFRKRTPTWGAIAMGFLMVVLVVAIPVAWEEYQAGANLESVD